MLLLENEKSLQMHKKSMGSLNPHAITHFSRVVSNYDLHELAGGLPLHALAAPNVHPSSKRGREVCNPTRKSNIPIK